MLWATGEQSHSASWPISAGSDMRRDGCFSPSRERTPASRSPPISRGAGRHLRLDQRRLRPARADAVDGDAAGSAVATVGVFERRHLAQPDQAELRGDVGRLGHRGDEAVDGGDVDDAAVAALGHAGQRQAHGVEGPRQVDGEDRVPDLRRRLGERHRALDAGIVDQHVRPAPGGEVAHHRLDGFDLAHVGVEEAHFRRAGGEHVRLRRLDLGGVGQPVQRHPRAGRGHRPGDRQPDPLHRSGDQRRPAFEKPVHALVAPVSAVSRRSGHAVNRRGSLRGRLRRFSARRPEGSGPYGVSRSLAIRSRKATIAIAPR